VLSCSLKQLHHDAVGTPTVLQPCFKVSISAYDLRWRRWRQAVFSKEPAVVTAGETRADAVSSRRRAEGVAPAGRLPTGWLPAAQEGGFGG
jgi:hypothetical protein